MITRFLPFYLLAVAYSSPSIESLHRKNFPATFIFGAASSAYQYEGEAFNYGKGPSIWDTFTRLHPEKIADQSSGNVAEEFYDCFKDDIALLKEIGLDSFRFSISWPRIFPKGKVGGGVNEKGVEFYDNLINELLSNDIKPMVTLFHWDVPQALEDEYGGFLNPKILKDYKDYVDYCFKKFGDRVKYWLTLNEPNLFSDFGYAIGEIAPGRCSNYIGNCTDGNSAIEPYLVVHSLILCHATAVKLYRDKYQASQRGEIGLTVLSHWMVPKFTTNASKKAALRALDFLFGWVAHPITYGDYPKTMRNLVGNRLPNFTEAQSKLVKGSYDFIGVNYYTAMYADESTANYSSPYSSYTTDSHVNLTVEKNGILIGQPTACSWLHVYPEGIRDLVMYIKRRYKNPSIYLTENGYGGPNNSSIPVDVSLNDSARISYHFAHLSYLLEAIKDGADVRGYYAWSFLDNFEWNLGYTIRFGITYIDYENKLKRYLKSSAFWFKSFLQQKNLLYSE